MKKYFLIVVALLVVTGLAFALANTNLLKGTFTLSSGTKDISKGGDIGVDAPDLDLPDTAVDIPTSVDTDGGGVPDDIEIDLGTDPLDPSDDGQFPDADQPEEPATETRMTCKELKLEPDNYIMAFDQTLVELKFTVNLSAEAETIDLLSLDINSGEVGFIPTNMLAQILSFSTPGSLTGGSSQLEGAATATVSPWGKLVIESSDSDASFYFDGITGSKLEINLFSDSFNEEVSFEGLPEDDDVIIAYVEDHNICADKLPFERSEPPEEVEAPDKPSEPEEMPGDLADGADQLVGGPKDTDPPAIDEEIDEEPPAIEEEEEEEIDEEPPEIEEEEEFEELPPAEDIFEQIAEETGETEETTDEPQPTITTYSHSFVDINNHWAESAISQFAEEQIVSGKTATRFDPNGNVTRAEYAKLLVRVAGFTEADAAGFSENYRDVSPSDWFYNYVRIGEGLGLFRAGENFNPNAPITRADATLWLVRLSGEELWGWGQGDIQFNDITTTDSFAYAIVIASKQGVIEGYLDGSFRPYSNMTRAEAVIMTGRGMETWLLQ